MESVILGRTNLRVSVVGLGCGGPSRLGQRTGRTEAESVDVVRRAMALGINFLDTAEGYGTEEIVGQAIKDVARDQIVISSKKGVYRDGKPVRAADYIAGVDGSLRRLGVDAIDIFHMHGVRPQQYEHARTEILPALQQLQQQGKVRFLGITEAFEADTRHEMLQQALDDDAFDVVMVGFNMLNQSARRTILPRTQARNVGVLDMFAVRRAFSRPARLHELLSELQAAGQVDAALANDPAPLDFLMDEFGAATVTEAAYRYCRHEPGIHVVLSGTGSVDHLTENVASLLQPPLPPAATARINSLFAAVDSVSGS